MFLADETVFQQQVRELWSIESSLTIIWVLVVVLILIGGACAARLGKLRRIGKALLEEQQKANKMLQYLNERAYDEAIKKKPVAPPPTKQEPDIYRI
jgi:Sec-independent protein translocase protein TatA